MRRKIFKWAAIGLPVLFIAMQAIRPARTNPPVDETRTLQANSGIPPQVTAILDRSCMDCHSSKTVWPWYAQVAPASWLVASDVNEGRRHWSASEWGTYDAKKRARVLGQMCDEVMSGDMPPSTYLIMHSAAKLQDPDKQAICEWTKGEK